MNEFCLESEYWTLSVWTKNLDKAKTLLQKTYAKRGLITPPVSLLRFSPALITKDSTEPLDQYPLSQAYFFENTCYEFEFRFSSQVSSQTPPEIQHKLAAINDSFRFIKQDRILRGMIQTANDVGQFSLPLVFTLNNGHTIHQTLSFEVLPTKITMREDLDRIYHQLDQEYPLWRFAFAKSTEQGSDRNFHQKNTFALLWLANFESLYDELMRNLKRIIHAPHYRLVEHKRYIAVERLRGKLSINLQEQIRHKFSDGKNNRRIQHSYQQLSCDTPENRFVKYLIQYSLSRLSQIQKATQSRSIVERLAPAFFQQLQNWQQSLRAKLNQPIFQQVGNFQGLQQVSLVLQQKTGYSGVFKIWQQWKMFLDTLGSQAHVGMKSMDDIYEVWCFLHIKNSLEQLGFIVQERNRASINKNYLEASLQDGLRNAFVLQRGQTQIRLAHEPSFGKQVKTDSPYFSHTVHQKPDIVLEVKHQDLPVLLWVFDAKYRVEQGSNGKDYVPEDAINQMHRYRDAILFEWTQQEQTSRPVFGAFALYPAFYEQEQEHNPYQPAIEAVNIGAFALLPSTDTSHQHWLQQFLTKQLGKSDYPYKQVYQQKSSRIVATGMEIIR